MIHELRCYLAERCISLALSLYPRGSKEGKSFATAVLKFLEEMKKGR